MRVNVWKKYSPTFVPESFCLDRNKLENTLGSMCQAEIVHEIIMLLSLIPISFSAIFGEFSVFLLTSFAALLVDCTFVVIQRYNRPRILKLLERTKRGSTNVYNKTDAK